MKSFKISKKKSLKPLMQGYPLSPNASITDKYKKKLKNLVNRMSNETEKVISNFFKSGLSKEYISYQDSLESSQRISFDESLSSQAKIILNKLKNKYKKIFNEKSISYADEMLEDSNFANKKSTELSFKLLSGGIGIKTALESNGISEVISSARNENVSLIQSIYSQYFTNIDGDVMRGISSGSITQMNENILKRGSMTERRAKNIADDQTKKVYNNLNKQRMQSQGLNKYIWRHSAGGQNPRQDHIDMDGNVYSFDDPPIIDKNTGERGIPGQAINCRCFMVPVIEFEDEEEIKNAA